MLFICCCIAATICVMSEPSEEGAAAVGGRSSLFVRTEIILADVDAGGLVGHRGENRGCDTTRPWIAHP
eukprot:scaffold1131_cov124-Isochrysis_galbana.AAC.2